MDNYNALLGFQPDGITEIWGENFEAIDYRAAVEKVAKIGGFGFKTKHRQTIILGKLIIQEKLEKSLLNDQYFDYLFGWVIINQIGSPNVLDSQRTFFRKKVKKILQMIKETETDGVFYTQLGFVPHGYEFFEAENYLLDPNPFY